MFRRRDGWKMHCDRHTLPSITALTKPVIILLNRLTMRPEARRRVYFPLPVGSIYWEDEMPSRQDKAGLSVAERKAVNRLFSLRREIWHGAELSPEDAAFWEAARAEAPAWALFQRLSLSDDDHEFLKQAEEEGEKAFEMLCAEADEVEITDKGEGCQKFSLIFDLTKDKDRPHD
jgi:hypothetical protein